MLIERVAARPATPRVRAMTFRLSAALAPLALLATTALAPTPLLARTPVALNATVSAADPRAAQAGQEILRKGGSATDAAIAMMLTLGVVEPHNSGIGGGGFLMHHDGDTGLLESIDGRETAPAAARPDRFLGPDGKPLPFVQAWPGGYSVGVPGNLRLAWDAHRKWGKLPWADLFQPAIKLAEDGYELGERTATARERLKDIWKDFPEIQSYFWVDGAPPPVGTLLKNPPLAALYKRLAAEGPAAFYHGDNAQASAKAVTDAPRNPVPMTMADLAGYEAKARKPVCGKYRAYTICGMGPASAGGVTVLEILGMVERFPLGQWGKDDPRSWHVIGEAMQLAYADRDTWLGDPDFVSVPVAGMIDPAYLKRRSAMIRLDRSLRTYEPGTPPGAQPRTAAASGPTANADHHSIGYDDKGTPICTVGAAGGRTIIMQVAKALIAHFDWGLSAQESIAHGLIYYNKDGLVLERGTALEAMKAPLERLGHHVTLSPLGLKANAAERTADGQWVGAADPRSPGVSLQE